jgi:hypothetical protein
VSGEGRVKVWVAVTDDSQGDSIVGEHMCGIECCYSYCIDHFFAGEEYASFEDVMIGDGKYHIIAIRQWELSDEVHGDGLEGKGAGGCNREKRRFGGVLILFI